MLTLAVLKLALIDHHPTAIVALGIALVFCAMLDLGWFDEWRN